jgi:cation:H+ antiporter
MNDYQALAAVFAGGIGEFFSRPRGPRPLAAVAPGIIGATVAAFATSSPELTVAVTSASAGRPETRLAMCSAATCEHCLHPDWRS